MDYEKKYPITQLPGEYLLMQWERGYKKVELSYKDRLIQTFTGSAVKKGLRISDTDLGPIELKFSEKPMGIDVIVDGYHSPANRSHPKKEMKKTATILWLIAVFGVLGALVEGIYIGIDSSIGMIVTSINVVIVTAYFVAAIFTGRAKPWAYYLGFSVFSLMFLLSLLTLVNGVTIVIAIAFIFRAVFLVMLILNLKHAVAMGRHLRYGTIVNDELLDR